MKWSYFSVTLILGLLVSSTSAFSVPIDIRIDGPVGSFGGTVFDSVFTTPPQNIAVINQKAGFDPVPALTPPGAAVRAETQSNTATFLAQYGVTLNTTLGRSPTERPGPPIAFVDLSFNVAHIADLGGISGAAIVNTSDPQFATLSSPGQFQGRPAQPPVVVNSVYNATLDARRFGSSSLSFTADLNLTAINTPNTDSFSATLLRDVSASVVFVDVPSISASEPSTIALLSSGAVGLLLNRYRRRVP